MASPELCHLCHPPSLPSRRLRKTDASLFVVSHLVTQSLSHSGGGYLIVRHGDRYCTPKGDICVNLHCIVFYPSCTLPGPNGVPSLDLQAKQAGANAILGIKMDLESESLERYSMKLIVASGLANFDTLLFHFGAFLSSTPPHTCRVLRSTWCRC